jgi:23S rRNA (uracil1939-C5)-methyltransferase
MSRVPIPPFELEVEHLDDRGHGLGVGPRGRTVRVRGAPPGARLLVGILGRTKKGFDARRIATIRPPPDAVAPRCAVFGLCGGCTLQELPLARQRALKVEAALRSLGGAPVVHPLRGVPEGFGHRNKIELSFGTRRYVSEEDRRAGAPLEGRFLGFHAPGRFDRVVDAERCELVPEAMNHALRVVRSRVLREDSPPTWNARIHEGFWRHLVLRSSEDTGEVLAVLVTAPGDRAPVADLAEALRAHPEARVTGVAWAVNPGVADVARGEIVETWGAEALVDRIDGRPFRVGPWSFFQTTTTGAALLYRTVGEALGRGGTLLDLYCGTGTVGLVLADGFDRVVGVEENPHAVADARANAAALGVDATYVAGRTEDALHVLDTTPSPRRIVVDPPRVGLHPAAARALAGAHADVLVYVACHPASLGRDRAALEAGGWRLEAVWPLDLFPQTAHLEVVARFVREAA